MVPFASSTLVPNSSSLIFAGCAICLELLNHQPPCAGPEPPDRVSASPISIPPVALAIGCVPENAGSPAVPTVPLSVQARGLAGPRSVWGARTRGAGKDAFGQELQGLLSCLPHFLGGVGQQAPDIAFGLSLAHDREGARGSGALKCRT